MSGVLVQWQEEVEIATTGVRVTSDGDVIGDEGVDGLLFGWFVKGNG